MKNILIIILITLNFVAFSQEAENETKEHKVEVFTQLNLLRIPEHNIGLNYKLNDKTLLSASVNYLSNIGYLGNYLLNNIDRKQKGLGGEIGIIKRINKIDIYTLINFGSYEKYKHYEQKKGYDYRDEITKVNCDFYGGIKLILDYNFSKKISLYLSISGAKAYGTKTENISDEYENIYYINKNKLSYLLDYGLGIRFKLFKL